MSRKQNIEGTSVSSREARILSEGRLWREKCQPGVNAKAALLTQRTCPSLIRKTETGAESAEVDQGAL